MALTPELEARIEKEIASLKVFHRTSLGKEDFMTDHTFYLANMDGDLSALKAAGLQEDQPEYFRGCFEVLVLAIGDRGGSSNVQSNEQKQYSQIELMVTDHRTELGIVGKYIADNSDDPAMVKKFKYIQKCSGIIDSATDIIGLTGMVDLYKMLALQIKPDGKIIDEAYCKIAKDNAVALLQKKGFVMVKGVPVNNTVDRQNRILTLCIQNQKKLKTFAKAAYCKNMEYYKTRYTSQFKRSVDEDDEDITIADLSKEPATTFAS